MRPFGVPRLAVWNLEWRQMLRRPRLLGWNVLVPMVLLLPVALSTAAAPHRSVVYSVFVVFFGTFGGCIPLVVDRARGWSEKVLLTGYGSHRWLAERVAASAAIDTFQLAPVLFLLLLFGRADPTLYGYAALAVAAALLAANAVGSLIARVVHSVAEAALVCGTVALFALHFSGVFRTAVTGSWGWRVERMSPFRPLVATMDRIASRGAMGNLNVGDWLGPLLVCAAMLVAAAAFAPRLPYSTSRELPAHEHNRPGGSV